MSADVIKLPFAVTRRAHSRKGRRSKNGTPEERASNVAAVQSAPADAAILRIVPTTPVVLAIDGRKLRDSPLRGKVALVSLGATVVGQMRTAELKGRPLVEIALETRREWLRLLRDADNAVRTIAIGLEKAMDALERAPQVMTPEEFEEAYDQAPPEIQQVIAAKIAEFRSSLPPEHDQ